MTSSAPAPPTTSATKASKYSNWQAPTPNPKASSSPTQNSNGGVIDDKIILIDEIFTPDSSRFWPADKYQAGRDQDSYDKQFVRNYLEEINFDKSGPGVELPDEIVEKTLAKYIEAYEVLTGKKFEL